MPLPASAMGRHLTILLSSHLQAYSEALVDTAAPNRRQNKEEGAAAKALDQVAGDGRKGAEEVAVEEGFINIVAAHTQQGRKRKCENIPSAEKLFALASEAQDCQCLNDHRGRSP